MPTYAVIFSGLHTCGNLSPSSLSTFLSDPSAVLLANVGCCYNHLDERFYRNPNLSDADNDRCNASPGFPLSKVLREKRFQLGRNARMMAAQPAGRMANKKEVS